jgi:dTDP-4-amino-4,6-dideoxygalactose transaminase
LIPYGKQDINQADIDSVVDVLHSDFLTQGPKVIEFEKKSF